MSAERRCARLLLHVPVRQELICQGMLELEHVEVDEDVQQVFCCMKPAVKLILKAHTCLVTSDTILL